MLIGVLGKSGSGKDTIADYVCENYGYTKIAFAKPIKDICRIMFGFNEEQLYGNKKETVDEYWGVSPRHMFQYIGTDVMRTQIQTQIPNIGMDFWVKCTEKIILNLLKENKKVIVSDVRFQNEIDLITRLGGVVIKLNRDSNNLKDGTESHISEQNIDNLIGNYLIENNSTLNELYRTMDNILYDCGFKKRNIIDQSII